MEELVTLAQAKAHLKLPNITVEDRDLQVKLAAAHELVGDYIKQRRDDDDGVTWAATVDAWDADTAPAKVKLAIDRMFANLYYDRGDSDDGQKQSMGELPRDVIALLYRLRDPALA